MAKNTYKKWMIVLVNLDLTNGVQIKKIRPCLVISPNVVNQHLLTVLVAPLTSTIRNIPTRINVIFNERTSEICFDQIKAIDITSVVKELGSLDNTYRNKCTLLLQTLFSDED
jgi:mRNA interferase MazF